MYLIDSHAHLDFKEFETDRDEVIQRAKTAGILKIINVGANLERSKKSVELANKYDNVYATLGVHPHDCKKDEINLVLEEFKKLIEKGRNFKNKIVAIGEIGLDYYRLEADHKSSETNIIEKQKEVFKALLNLAKELNLPVILHCREAYNDMLEILKNLKNNSPRFFAGVTHCFAGNWIIAQKFLDLGLYLGFTGAITYPGKQATKIEEVIRKIPLERILIETDSPYLAPIPYRGQRNEPAYVIKVAEKIAQIKNLPFEVIAEQTTKNTYQLFKIN